MTSDYSISRSAPSGTVFSASTGADSLAGPLHDHTDPSTNPSMNPSPPHSDPTEFAWLIERFAKSVPGILHTLLISSDGLPLIASNGMSRTLSEQLAAVTSGLLGLGHNTAALLGAGGCEQIMLRLTHGTLLVMRIGEVGGLAVQTDVGCDLRVVAYEMNQLVSSVGHVLTPQLRADLRSMSISRAHHS